MSAVPPTLPRRSRALRVALIASSRHPIAQPFAGGLEAHVWQLARALTSRGHHVTLFAAPGSDAAVAADLLEAEGFGLRDGLSDAAAGDVSMPAPVFLAEHHAYLQLMIGLGGPLADRFDVVHNHSLHHLPVAMAPSVRVPMVSTLHTPPTPWIESAITVGGGAGVTFVAVSEHTAGEWHHATGPVQVVLNGVDLADWPVGPGGDELIWSGRLVPEKGAHLAIAAARAAGMRLRLAGPISDRAYFDAQVAPQLGDDVRYLGHLGRAELADAVGRSAAALVTPEWNEPYGLVVAEALACGTPVAAFARGAIPEIVTPACSALAEPGSVESLAAAIRVAVGRSRAAARLRAELRCSAEHMVDAYEALYGDLAEAVAA